MAAPYRFFLLIAITASSAQAQTAPEAVRVRLGGDAPPTTSEVRSTVAPLVLDGAWTVPVGRTLRLQAQGREVEASADGKTHRANVIRLSGGPLAVRLGTSDRTYLGDLTVRVRQGRLEMVNTVPVEDYVASVVASEYPFPEAAGIQAQAVLARTYALRRLGSTLTYDLDDHQGSQVYRGEGSVTARSRQAALATAGEVLTYGGTLAETPYYSSSGGYTADNEAVWQGAPLPYLRGVPDPTDADAPDHRWTTSAPRRAVLSALQRQTGRRVTSIDVGERSRNGRVQTVRLGGGGTVTGPEFRTAVNAAIGTRTIRSTRFEIREDGDRYVFEGGGYGHGVGMSQYGARGLARQGRTYREILAHYFQGTSLDRLGGPALAASSTSRAETPRWPSEPRIVDLEPDTDAEVTARPRTWPVPRRVAREAEAAPRRRAW